ncbi:tetratricopeptide repeat protein [Mucilaginibacter ximonensis]|uniref:Tetratricopeptide repeat protein n=1 Tax=Mucilaginibacter ximonensis TaxID=538021 RepID=A0ABW5YE76_9SPHI
MSLTLTVYAQQKQIDSLRQLINTSNIDSLEINYNYQLSQFYSDKPDSALKYIGNGIRLARSKNYKSKVATGLYLYGYTYNLLGNYPAAIKNLFESLQLCNELNQRRFSINCYTMLASIYDDQKDEEKAIHYLQQAIALSREFKLDKALAQGYSSAAFYYNRANKPQMAFKYANLANVLAARLNDELITAYAQLNLGNTYLLLKQYDTGLAFLKTSVATTTRLGEHYRAMMANMLIADHYIAVHQTDSAKVYCINALNDAKIVGYTFQIMDSTEKLAALYDGYDQAKATAYYKQALALNKQLFDTEKTREFQNLTIAEEQRRRELEEQKLKEEEERKTNLQLVAIALFIPIFLMIVFLLSRTKMHRKLIDFMGVLSLMLLFEFITLLLHPLIERLTHHTPVFELIILVAIAAFLVPLHHSLTHWLKNKLSHQPAAHKLPQ